MICALCLRYMRAPAIVVGGQPIGPKCARRAGLIKHVARKGSAVRVVHGKALHFRVRSVVRDDQTLDLFGVTA